MKGLASIVVVLFAGLLMYAIGDFPAFGDPHSPANSYVSAHYLQHSMEDGHVPNVVTSVLADYRSFDTMFETAVVFIAGLAILSVLRRKRQRGEKAAPFIKSGVIIRTAARMTVPFMQIFSFYVISHGHYSPGGGFQGGVILGAALILLAMAFGLSSVFERISETRTMVLCAIGVLIFSGVGATCVALGGNFLDYSAWASVFGIDGSYARYYGMFAVEIGVGLAVMCGMLGIYASMASDGKMDQGL